MRYRPSSHPSFALSWMALALAAALVGCEASRFDAARAADTPAAYRRFLTRYAKGERAAKARLHLEGAVYRQARAADRPLGYRGYLARYPQGRYAEAVRSRLAELALARAKSSADLELVAERYRGTAPAKKAQAQLASALAKEALASRRPLRGRRFLERFADHERASDVREHLASLLIGAAGVSVDALERFIARWRGTRAALAARKQLGARLAALVARDPQPALLEHLRSRFPRHPQLARLEALVRGGQLRDAFARLDLIALARLRAASPDDDVAKRAAKVLAWCRARPRRCTRYAALARQASPFQPSRSVAALTRALYDPDPLVAWGAMAALSWHRDVRAGRRLLRRVGAPRIATVWAAAGYFRAWLARLPSERRARFVRRELGRAFRRENPDEAQRRGWVAAAFGGASEQSRGRAMLMGLAQRGRALTARYLAREASRHGATGSKGGRDSALRSALQARARWLESAFPSELTKASRATAALAERDLHAIVEVLRTLPDQKSATLRRELSSRLARWRLALARVDSTFKAAKLPSLHAEQRAHAGERGAALAKLRARRDVVARAIVAALSPPNATREKEHSR
ncbi:MAG: hypothetical protein KC503_46170 [Myxococcales bacterium]|nr:hypothetical protein [Myxococcales bacterium]